MKTSREDYQQWWAAFRDPTLNRLVDIAYNQNLTLMEAGARVIEARAALGQAIGEVYPQTQQLNGTGDYLQPSRTDATSNPDDAITSSQFWRVDLGGQVAWELDLWGKFRHGVEQADAAYLASIATYDDVLVTLIGDVASDYIQIRTLQAQIAIARDNVVKQKAALQIAQRPLQGRRDFGARRVPGRERAGADGGGDPAADGADAAGARTRSRVLLGLPPAVDRRAARPFARHSRRRRATSRSASRPTSCAAGPTCARPSSRRRRRARKVGIAAADLYPAFSLGGAFGTLVSTTNGNTIGELFTSPEHHLRLRSVVQLAGAQLRPDHQQGARCRTPNLQALLIDYKNVVLKAQREVENGLAGFVEGRQQVAYLRRSAVAANSALTVAIAQYQLGSRDFTTVLTAEQNLYQAQNNLAAAEGGVSISLTTTYRALGGGWQIREGERFRQRRDARRNARPHQLGRHAAARRSAAAAGARPSRPCPTAGRPCGLRNGERREDLISSTPRGDGARPRRRPDRRARRRGGRARRAPRTSSAPVGRRLGPRQAGSVPTRSPAGGASGSLRDDEAPAPGRPVDAVGAAPAATVRAPPPAQPAAATVPVVPPKVQTVSETLVVTGNAEAVEPRSSWSRACPAISNRSISRTAQLVKKGDLLFTIQQDQYKASCQQADGAARRPRRPRATTPISRSGATPRCSSSTRPRRSTSTTGCIEEKTAQANILAAQAQVAHRQAQPRPIPR